MNRITTAFALISTSLAWISAANAQLLPSSDGEIVSQSEALGCPDLAVRPDGSFAVAWKQASQADVYVHLYNSDGTLASQAVAATVSSFSTDCNLGTNSDGFLLACLENGALTARLFDQNFSAVAGPFVVDDTTPEFYSGPVRGLPGGDFVVYWHGNQGGYRHILGRRVDETGPVGPIFQTDDELSAEYPDFDAAVSQGAGVAVWRSVRGSYPAIRGRMLDDQGMPIGSSFQVNTYNQDNDYEMRANANGERFAVSWRNVQCLGPPCGNPPPGSPFSLQDVVVRRYENGVPIDDEDVFVVEGDATRNIHQLDSALLADGGVAFAYVDSGPLGSMTNRLVSEYLPTAFGPTTRWELASMDNGSLSCPTIAAGAESAVLLWLEHDFGTDVRSLRFQRFATLGPAPVPSLGAFGIALLGLLTGMAAVYLLRASNSNNAAHVSPSSVDTSQRS